MNIHGDTAPGLKESDLGFIPTDWHCGNLSEFWSVMDCKHVTAPFVASGFPLASIRETQSRIVDLSEANQTTEDYYRKMIEGGRTPEAGDLIFSRNATVGEVAKVTESHPLFAMGQDVCLLRRRRQDYSTDFIQQFLQSGLARRQFSDAMVGSTFKRMNVKQIKALSVVFPPAREQEVIAEALSDADALIEGLERLIAKKRLIKQGAMQDLLTAKRRLPGFSGEWVERILPDLAEIRSGGTPSTIKPEMWDGDIAWCTPTDITALKGSRFLSQTSRCITELGLRKSAAELLPSGTIVMTSRATIGECAIATVPMSTNQGFKNFIARPGTDRDFLFYLLRAQKPGFIELCSGSTFLEIGMSQLRKYLVRAPADSDEQAAIAAILKDMDAEIEALENRLEKARAVKEGMMQNLLTGRIRLV